jgi:hypothetical protein
MKTTHSSAATDFDFFIGHWNVAHRRLKDRLNGCTEWVEFGGQCATKKILGGLGNVDDNIVNLPSGPYRAATFRTFNEQTGLWSIWWLDARYPGQLDVPVVGQFEHGLGSFFADDTLNNQAIKVRFLWTMPQPNQPRWEQAFSPDAGVTWETNWVMDFTVATLPDSLFGTDVI